MGIRELLPREIVLTTPMRELGDPLCVLPASLTVGEEPISVREGVWDRLLLVQKFLPPGYAVRVVDGYRSLDKQRQMWEDTLAYIRHEFPLLSLTECEQKTRKIIAQPRAQGGGHQTGGAVDVVLLDQGQLVDMGTRVLEFNERTKTSAKIISSTQKHHRLTLQTAMQKAGFSNYPSEWWHYSYGDQMWAAYSRQKNAIYGSFN
jgi:D-alanyl-D-alanine dipeptidase